MKLYFDTSALVKLVVDEDGSALVAELWATRYPAFSSLLSYVEARAAMASAQRSGRLSAGGHSGAVSKFETARRNLTTLGVDQALIRHAAQLAEAFGLRGYDSVHLASALALGDSPTFVTWDARLRDAAAASGCAVAPAGH